LFSIRPAEQQGSCLRIHLSTWPLRSDAWEHLLATSELDARVVHPPAAGRQFSSSPGESNIATAPLSTLKFVEHRFVWYPAGRRVSAAAGKCSGILFPSAPPRQLSACASASRFLGLRGQFIPIRNAMRPLREGRRCCVVVCAEKKASNLPMPFQRHRKTSPKEKSIIVERRR